MYTVIFPDYVCPPYSCPKRPEKDIRSIGTGIADNYELIYGGLDLKLRLQEGQPVF